MPKTNKTKTKLAAKRAAAQVSKHKITEEKAKQNLREIITYIGENPAREGLLETPKRIVKSWDTLFSGYKKDPAALLKTFTEGSCEEMVILKDIEFYSTCEHHFAPFLEQSASGIYRIKKLSVFQNLHD